jgi:hypothetical protein
MEHSIFYYPYANFTDNKSPLLKAAALYFDKLFILEPEKVYQGQTGTYELGKTDECVNFLRDKNRNIIEPIRPEEVLYQFEKEISDAIRGDLNDPEFVSLCEKSGKHPYWKLAMEKIPKEIREDPKFKPLDQSMQKIMGEIPKSILNDIEWYTEDIAHQYKEYPGVYDELRYTREYRIATFPLALGESIMLNHALFAGLLLKQCIPITDEDFHYQLLALKIKRALKNKNFQQILEVRNHLKTNQLAFQVLTGNAIDLPGFKPNTPIDTIWNFREKHSDELKSIRFKMAQMAYKIENEPWSADFQVDLKYNIIPDFKKEIKEFKKAQNSWLKTAGLLAGTIAATISLIINPTPVITIAAIGSSLGLFSDNVVPCIEWFKDWRDGKHLGQESGLNYMIKFKE